MHRTSNHPERARGAADAARRWAVKAEEARSRGDFRAATRYAAISKTNQELALRLARDAGLTGLIDLALIPAEFRVPRQSVA